MSTHLTLGWRTDHPRSEVTWSNPPQARRLGDVARTASERLSASWRAIPDVTQQGVTDITELEEARRRYTESTRALHTDRRHLAQHDRTLVLRPHRKQIRRGVHRSTRELEMAIELYIDATNTDPKPFIWTKSANQILDTIAFTCNELLQRTGNSGR